MESMITLRGRIKKDILNGNITEQLILFLFPLFLGYLLQQLYGFVDNIVLGRLISKEALAAVGGSANSLINIVLNFVGGITSAITVLVAQNYGKGDMERVSSSVKTGISLSIVLGAILAVLMSLAAPFWLRLMNEPSETVPLSLTYMYLYFGSMIFYFVYQSGVSILRALGDSRRPLMLIGITAASKILLDLLFAGVFRLGVFGTSLATFLSHLICAVVILFIFNKTIDVYQFSLKQFGIEKEDLGRVFTVGIPFAIQSMMFAIPNAVIQFKINSFGTDAVAAYSAYNGVDALFWCFSNAVCTATITMASQNFGHRNKNRVRKILWTACGIEAVAVLFYAGAFWLWGRPLLTLFLKDEVSLDIAQAMLKLIALSYPLTILVDILSSVFKSCGLIRQPLLIAIFTVCVARILFIAFFPIDDPIKAVLAFPLSWILTSCGYLTLYFIKKERFRD
jgi:putative MATE family efflux protein